MPFPPTKICVVPIPVSPKTGGRSITAGALRKADIILTADPGSTSVFIRRGMNSDVSHAMLYNGSGSVVEAIGSGVRVVSLATALHEVTLAVVYRRTGLTAEAADRVSTYATDLATRGTSYDRIQAALVGMRILPAARAMGLHPSGGDAYYCSELILRAFLAAGVPIDGNATMGSPGYLLEDHTTLEYVGHLRGTQCETSITVKYEELPGRD